MTKHVHPIILNVFNEALIMKILAINLLKLLIVWAFFAVLIASCTNKTYAKDLSKSNSVTPQRHCGFIVPQICKGSQSLHLQGASVSATQTRLYSLYGRMTRQNKSAMANMSGGTVSPRVSPPTLTSQVMVASQNSKLTGGNHHA